MLPGEVITHIITDVLVCDTKYIHSLIINKYIWDLVDVAWPHILKAQSTAHRPCSHDIIPPHEVIDLITIPPKARSIYTRSINHLVYYKDTPYHPFIILTIYRYKQIIEVRSWNYSISFDVINERYVIYCCYNVRQDSICTSYIPDPLIPVSRDSIIKRNNIKRLLTILLPDIAPSFIFNKE